MRSVSMDSGLCAGRHTRCESVVHGGGHPASRREIIALSICYRDLLDNACFAGNNVGALPLVSKNRSNSARFVVNRRLAVPQEVRAC